MLSFGPRSLTRIIGTASLGVAFCTIAPAFTAGAKAVLVGHGVQSQSLSWQTTFAAAIRKSKASGMPIFVDFHAEWCGPCKMLEETFKDPRVAALLRRTTCLSIDVDQDQADARRFRVSSIPRLLLLTPDGSGVLWDTMGYRDADTFVQDLSEALHVKAPSTTAKAEPPAMTRVEAALSAGAFDKLKAADPVAAKSGLRLLVLRLGVFDEANFQPVAVLLQKAGRNAVPALLEGMAHKSLAVRVGAYKVLQVVLKKDEVKGLTFDPWAIAQTRSYQLQAWQRLRGTY